MATIRKRGNKYQVQVRVEGITSSRTFTLKSDAVKWGREQEVSIEQGSYISKKDKILMTTTLSALLIRWESEVLINLKSHRVDKYKVAILVKSIGDTTLDKVTSQMLVKFRDNRLKLVSNQTVKHELGIIRRAMKKGIEWGLCASVPYVAMPSLKGQARTRRLKPHESDLLFKNVDDYLKQVIVVLIETAMRRGELAALKIEDINLDDRLLTLRDTKNGTDRVIPISNKAASAITILLSKANSPRLINYSKEWLTDKFIGYCESIGINDFRLHDLRHEGVSRLFEKGLNMAEVSTISGHKDLQMLKRYTHINPTTLLNKIN